MEIIEHRHGSQRVPRACSQPQMSGALYRRGNEENKELSSQSSSDVLKCENHNSQHVLEMRSLRGMAG